MTKQILPPVHTDFDSAFVVEDYPYGFTLRTQMRVWIETGKNKEQRVVSCTLNPKSGKWNAPKKSTYDLMKVLFIDSESGHVHNDGMSGYNTENADAFWTEYAEGLTQYHQGKLQIFAAMHEAQTETGLRYYGATSEQHAILTAKRDEILTRKGWRDLIAKIV